MCSESLTENCVLTYNNELLDPMKPTIKISLYVAVSVGLLLSTAAVKWRLIAHSFLYLECLTQLLAMLLANQATFSYSKSEYTMLFALIFVFYYCHSRLGVVVLTLTFAIHLFVGL